MDKEKKNGKKKLIVTMAVSLILLVGITVSYAYIALISQNKDQEIDLNAGNLHLVFKDADAGSINGSLNLGSSITKGFTIENTGNGDAYAKINWDNLVNTYLPQSLTYTLECDMGEGNWTSIDTYRTNVQRSSEPSKKTLADRLLIPEGEKYTYRLKIN